MSKVITFFLASSITDLEDDRIAVGDFINQINNIYQPFDVFIKLYKCEGESMNHAVTMGGSQKTLDELIQESDLCFVIFWHKAGEVTEHELEIALESFKKKKQPKVVVYFKCIEDGDEIPEEINRIMQVVDDELLHYHREYSHIDSLKLGIITQLQIHGFINADIKVEKDAITVSGQPIVSTHQLPLFSENEEYCRLLNRFKKLDGECSVLLKQYCQNKNNARIYRDYHKKVKERNRIQEDISEMADGILNIGKYIAQITSTEVITERIQRAIKCFDCGNYDGVLDILTPEEIEDRARLLDFAEEQIIIARNGIVEEYKLRILALEAQGKWLEVDKTYGKAIEQVENRCDMPKSIMFEYAEFLYQQRKYECGIEICEKLLNIGSNGELGIYVVADVLDLLGKFYFAIDRFDKAEAVLQDALSYREADLLGLNGNIQLADTCVNLAMVYFIVNRHFDAEKLYLKALSIYQQQVNHSLESMNDRIAKVSLELGDLYYMINRHFDAEKMFLDARRKYDQLVKRKEKKYIAAYAEACNKASNLMIAVESHKIMDRYSIEALRVKQCLTQINTTAYFEYLQHILEKLFYLWLERGEKEHALRIQSEVKRIQKNVKQNGYNNIEREKFHELYEAFYQKQMNKELVKLLCDESLFHYSALAQENPEAFEESLAQAHNTLAVFCTLTRKMNLAEYHYAKAIELREMLYQREPSSMRKHLAASYSNLAHHFDENGQYEKSESMSLKAVYLYSSVSDKNAGAFDTDLARNWHYLGNIYTKTGKIEKAEHYYLESLLLYIKLFEKSPRAYVDRIINTIADISMMFNPLDSILWMREFTDEHEVFEWLNK